jgi:hypothetical protein
LREVISLRDRTDVRTYRIELAAAHTSMTDVFPNARAAAQTTFLVDVSDVADLNRRLAALIDAGASVVAVTPADGLEARLTRGGGEAT